MRSYEVYTGALAEVTKCGNTPLSDAQVRIGAKRLTKAPRGPKGRTPPPPADMNSRSACGSCGYCAEMDGAQREDGQGFKEAAAAVTEAKYTERGQQSNKKNEEERMRIWRKMKRQMNGRGKSSKRGEEEGGARGRWGKIRRRKNKKEERKGERKRRRRGEGGAGRRRRTRRGREGGGGGCVHGSSNGLTQALGAYTQRAHLSAASLSICTMRNGGVLLFLTVAALAALCVAAPSGDGGAESYPQGGLRGVIPMQHVHVHPGRHGLRVHAPALPPSRARAET
ncbi:Protein of unknown function [Gryllus bimaculatus]|nr:Protein of unknown function [Gryllus bimaculatus]